MSAHPVHEIRFGSIRAAVWANQTESGPPWFNVTVVRRYRLGQEWKESSSFGRDELPLVSKALDFAYAWIWAQCESKTEGPAGTGRNVQERAGHR